MHRPIELDGGGDDVDTLLDTLHAHRLRTEDATVRHGEQQLEMYRMRSGVVTRVMAGMQIYLLKAADTGAP